ncbi:MAG TPA: transporter substrate-binding domain-containing protein [Candidatus Methylomirabilis sp.]|nr:transporter substrate-binding domain-containing protein [Candidatus Methylomirabilis sp.]
MVRRPVARLALLSALMLCLAMPWPAESVDTLRVCADPDNLPFSSSEGPERGLYVELAELVAARMGVRAEYFWWRSYFGKRTVRNTLLSDACDAYFGLPADAAFMGQSVTMTRPFLDMGYAVIGPKPLTLSSLDDLRGRRVAVSFGSYPQILLSSREGFELVTFRQPEEALQALGKGEVAAAFVWGPTAGYYNRTTLGGAYQIVPVAGPGLTWSAAVGVRKGKDELRAVIDRELAALQPDIVRLADKYGFPSGVPIPAESAPSSAAPPTVDTVATGRSLFNQHCAHCHAPNAMSPEQSRDLRRLRLRYGDQMRDVAVATITGGRPARGMPTWGDALGPEAIREIVTFLESVQN